MLKFFFAFIVIIHGLIHLMGSAKAFHFTEINQLIQPITKPAGAMWGLSALLFFLAAVLFLAKKESWWMWAIPAVAVSQILIFTSWQDAKFGTIANLLITLGILPGYGNWSFKKLVTNELQPILTQKTTTSAIVSEEGSATLPTIVQMWLRSSGVVGKPAASKIHLWQKGQMRISPNGKWVPVTAEQYFTVNPPGFIWLADVELMPFLHLAGRDKYMDGSGHMLVKALSLVPVADAKGPATDQGSLLRYLAETVWFPSAALSDYIQWENLDATSAKATMTYSGVSASGIFHFKENGDFHSFEANRYYNRNGPATLERWYIKAKDWKELNGVRVPVVCEVTWKLKEGDFTWFKLEITSLRQTIGKGNS